MQKPFKVPVTSVATHPTESSTIALGFIDGRIACYSFHFVNNRFQELWSSRLKRSIRALEFSTCGTLLFAISANRAICVYEFNTGTRLRCVKKSHSSAPNVLQVLPSWVSNQQSTIFICMCVYIAYVVASGSENGEACVLNWVEGWQVIFRSGLGILGCNPLL